MQLLSLRYQHGRYEHPRLTRRTGAYWTRSWTTLADSSIIHKEVVEIQRWYWKNMWLHLARASTAKGCEWFINKCEELFGNLNRTYAKFENYLQLSRTSDTEAEITRWKSVVDTVKGQIQQVTSRLKVPREPSLPTKSGRLSQHSKLSAFLTQEGTKQLGEAVLK